MRVILSHNVPIWHSRAGGGQRIHHEIAVHLAGRGHDVTMVHVGGGADAPADLPFRSLHVPYTERPVVAAHRIARRVARDLRARPVDVVYASAREGAWLPRVLPASVGLMATSHHPDPPPLPELDWLRHPLRSLTRARRGQEPLLEAALLRGADHVAAISEWSAERLRRLGYIESDRPVGLIRNGLSDAWFDDDPTPPATAHPTDLFFVGRLDPQKGLDVLLRALARPELAGRTLRVVGDGPDGAASRALVSALGVADRVRFEGGAPNEVVRALMGRSDVVVVPSRTENYPLSVLEALAARRPVVTTPVGGIPEMVDDGVHALLVPPGDVGALAGALHRMLTDPSLRARLAEAGRARAEEHRWANVIPRVEEELERTRAMAGGRRG